MVEAAVAVSVNLCEGALLPLDGCRGLGADVKQHAVNTLNLIENAVRGLAQQVVPPGAARW